MLTGAMRLRLMAAIGFGGALRGTPLVEPVEHLLCNSSRPVSALVSVDNELVMEAGEPVPRLVFGAVPTFQEAKEATEDLKEVLDAMYPQSPNSFESETSLIPGLSLPLNTEIVENRSDVIMKNNTSNLGPAHVHQALHFLRHCPKIQNLIATVASDQNVHQAVLENSEVKKFLHANQTGCSDTLEDEVNVTPQEGKLGTGATEKLRNVKDFIIEMVTNLPIHLPGLFGPSATESISESDRKENTTKKAEKSGSSFMEKLRNLKDSMVEMATNVPKYLPKFNGFSASQSASGSDHKENTQSFPPEFSLGTSLTGLAIMVIMVVVFKRV